MDLNLDTSTELYSNGSWEYDDDNETWSLSCELDYSPEYPMDVDAFIVNGIFVVIMGFLGIVGNIITMIIFNKNQMKSSTNFLFSALAFCETVVNVSSILIVALPKIHNNTGIMHDWYYFIYPRYTPFVYPIWMMAQMLAVYLTLAVTMERFVAIYHPLRVKSLCTYKRAQTAFIVMFVSSVIYNMPRFWEIDSQKFTTEIDNSTIYCLFYSDVKKNYLYKTIYSFWFYTIIVFLVPFSAITVLNALIYKRVRKANSDRERLSLSQKKEIDIAVVLLCIVLAFFFCNILGVVINYLHIYDKIKSLVVMIDNILVTSNSLINLIIYLTFVEKFRREFLLVFKIHSTSVTVSNGDESSSQTTTTTSSIALNRLTKTKSFY